MSETLRGLREDIRSDILAKAVDKGAEPIVAAAKMYAPIRTGALRESIVHGVRKNAQDGTAYAIIGPDRRYYVAGVAMSGRTSKYGRALGADRPAWYAHLVEFGHALVAKGSAKKGKGSGKVVGHVPAKPFLRPGVMAGKDAAGLVMAQEVERQLGLALRKRARNMGKTSS